MAVKGKKRQTDRHVEAVLASCEIMDSFLHCPTQTLKQIIDQTNLTRNRVMRLAGTLEARGYLHRDSRTGSYGLGTMFMSLGRVYESQSNVGSLGQPILQELAHTTGESASIYVLDHLERVVLAREEGKMFISHERRRIFANSVMHKGGGDRKVGRQDSHHYKEERAICHTLQA